MKNIGRKIKFKIKKTFRYLFFETIAEKLIQHRVITIVIPGILNLYFLTLDLWIENWPSLKNNTELHSKLFTYCIVLSLFIIFIRAIVDYFEERSDKKFINFLQNFSFLTSKAVKMKLIRFKEAAKDLDPTKNIFLQITKPTKQIDEIICKIEDMLRESFGIGSDYNCINIMDQSPVTNEWNYWRCSKKWSKTNPKDLIENKNSAMSKCVDDKEIVFHACKKLYFKILSL